MVKLAKLDLDQFADPPVYAAEANGPFASWIGQITLIGYAAARGKEPIVSALLRVFLTWAWVWPCISPCLPPPPPPPSSHHTSVRVCRMPC